jgi:hypothetical protein
MENDNYHQKRYRGSRLNRVTFAVNHIFQFCLQIGSTHSESETFDNERAINSIKQNGIKSKLTISEPIYQPVFEFLVQ